MTEEQSWLLWEQVARAVHRHVFHRSQDVLAALPPPASVGAPKPAPTSVPERAPAPVHAVAPAPMAAPAPTHTPAPGPELRRVRVRGAEPRAADRLRRMALMQKAMQILAQRKRGMSRERVMAGLRRAFPPLPYEQGLTAGKQANRFEKKCDWILNIPVSCGWVTKSRGHWQLTATGDDALQRTATPQELMTAAHSQLGAGDTHCVMTVRAERRDRARQAEQLPMQVAVQPEPAL